MSMMLKELIFAIIMFSILIVAGFVDKNKREGKEFKGLILSNPAYIMYTRRNMA